MILSEPQNLPFQQAWDSFHFIDEENVAHASEVACSSSQSPLIKTGQEIKGKSFPPQA